MHLIVDIRAGDKLELRLTQDSGELLAQHDVDLQAISATEQRALFDLHRFVDLYASDEGEVGRTAEQIVAESGCVLATKLLGPRIFGLLDSSTDRRFLVVRLPEPRTSLSAALHRVPWECARCNPTSPTLADKNLIVRIAVGEDQVQIATDLLATEPLRALFVFADTHPLSPLSTRAERRDLMSVFRREIYPSRRVEADFLAHGVTRTRLIRQIRDRGGYHILHWSGHGAQNRLELLAEDGMPSTITGEELAQLFADAGGFKPLLAFLSACSSGDLATTDPNRSLRQLLSRNPADRRASDRSSDSHTGVAHALVRTGVKSVIAMRFSVGDDYARALAVDFYRHALATSATPSAAEALNLARKTLKQRLDVEIHPCDHATPVLLGEADAGLCVRPGRSTYSATQPRLLGALPPELDVGTYPAFVGRERELAALRPSFSDAGFGDDTRPIMVLDGLGGMGKSALAAEIIDLWKDRFVWVLPFQSKISALDADATLREVHANLVGELGVYHGHVAQHPADAIWRQAETGEGTFQGQKRHSRLAQNLVRAMQDEAILLVLDNFDTHLSQKGGDGEWEFTDERWGELVRALALGLVGTSSRVLITTRRTWIGLADSNARILGLGPLSDSETVLYVRNHPWLKAAIRSSSESEKALAVRVVEASHGHPLLLERLAQLAENALPDATKVLDQLETNAPTVVIANAAASPTDEEYLYDALVKATDATFLSLSADARLLLWVVAQANEAVSKGLIRKLWVDVLQQRARPVDPDQVPSLIAEVQAARLLTTYIKAEGDPNPNFLCHEVVRERVDHWMDAHPEECVPGGRKFVQKCYGESLATFFQIAIHRHAASAIEAGRRAVRYLVEAEAHENLASFASALVSSCSDSAILWSMIPDLRTAEEKLPPGQTRAAVVASLATALHRAGELPDCLATWERVFSEEGLPTDDLGWIHFNYAIALRDAGRFKDARRHFSIAAEQAEDEVGEIGIQVELHRTDLEQGISDGVAAVQALGKRLEDVLRELTGGNHEDQDTRRIEQTSRALLSALDVLRAYCFHFRNWSNALLAVDHTLEIEQSLGRSDYDKLASRFNRAVVLTHLQRADEAQMEFELYLEANRGDVRVKANALSALAAVAVGQKELDMAVQYERRALTIRQAFPDPHARALSHNNLASWLSSSGRADLVDEGRFHRLAALCYRAVAPKATTLESSIGNYAIEFAARLREVKPTCRRP